MANVLSSIKLTFDDVLIVPQRSTIASRKEVSITRTFACPHSGSFIVGSPIMAANMSTVGTVDMANALGNKEAFTSLCKFTTIGDLGRVKYPLHTFASFGLKESIDDIKKSIGLINPFNSSPPLITLDVPHGHMEAFLERISRVREAFPNAIIAAGNVVTGEGAEDVIKAGATFAKCGIANGNACRTKNKTGVHYPQFSTVLECAEAAHSLKGYIISDGGHKEPADVCKAICGGADMVMLGSMLSGHFECLSPIEQNSPPKQLKFYGMSSSEAMNTYHGGVAEYRTSEGESLDIPYKGMVESTIMDIYGGIRSCASYCGADSIEMMQKRAKIVAYK